MGETTRQEREDASKEAGETLPRGHRSSIDEPAGQRQAVHLEREFARAEKQAHG